MTKKNCTASFKGKTSIFKVTVDLGHEKIFNVSRDVRILTIFKNESIFTQCKNIFKKKKVK